MIRLVADEDEIVRRLRQRAIEQGRVDDSEEAIRHRQEVYQRETAPLLEMFREQGLLVEVDGLGAVDDVTERIFTALEPRGLLGGPRLASCTVRRRATTRRIA